MRRGLWTRSKRNEADAVGCLIMMGGLILLPAFVYGWGSFAMLVKGLLPASGNWQWSDISRIWNGVVQWVLGRSSGGGGAPLSALFVSGLFFLLWQWTAVLLGWRPRLASRRIWMISSCYFVACMGGIAVATWEQRDMASTNAFGAWLMVTLFLCVVPGAFLAVTVPLWVMAARHRGRTDEADGTAPPSNPT